MHARHVEEDKARRGRKLTLTEAGRGDEQLRSQLQQMLLTERAAALPRRARSTRRRRPWRRSSLRSASRRPSIC